MIYKCPRCLYESDRKQYILKHLNKKKICELKFLDINPKEYQDIITRSNSYELKLLEQIEDMKKENKNKEKENQNKEKEYKKIEKQNEKMKEKIENMKKENQKIKKQIKKEMKQEIKIIIEENRKLRKENEKLKNEVKIINNTTNDHSTNNKKIINDQSTNNITNHITFVLNPRSDPEYNYLTDKDYRQCLRRMIKSIPELIQKVHFNPKHPENHNIYIPNIQLKYAMIYDGNEWCLKNMDDTIDNLLRDHEMMLEEWIDCGGKKFPKAMENFKTYLEKKDEYGVEKFIKEEIKLLLYNKREMIKDTKKKLEII